MDESTPLQSHRQAANHPLHAIHRLRVSSNSGNSSRPPPCYQHFVVQTHVTGLLAISRSVMDMAVGYGPPWKSCGVTAASPEMPVDVSMFESMSDSDSTAKHMPDLGVDFLASCACGVTFEDGPELAQHLREGRSRRAKVPTSPKGSLHLPQVRAQSPSQRERGSSGPSRHSSPAGTA